MLNKDTYQSQRDRVLSNSIMLYDMNAKKADDIIQYTESSVNARMYACGFKIDQKLYIIGGLGASG